MEEIQKTYSGGSRHDDKTWLQEMGETLGQVKGINGIFGVPPSYIYLSAIEQTVQTV